MKKQPGRKFWIEKRAFLRHQLIGAAHIFHCIEWRGTHDNGELGEVRAPACAGFCSLADFINFFDGVWEGPFDGLVGVQLGLADTFDNDVLNQGDIKTSPRFRLVGEAGRERIRLRGDVVEQDVSLQGCRFQHRCPRKIGRICENDTPPVRAVTGTHRIACHIAVEELRNPGPLTANPVQPVS